MNRTKWLVAILLASWTLNVALGVALYLRTRYPAGGYWSPVPAAFDRGVPPFAPGRMPGKLMMDEDLRGRMDSLRGEFRGLVVELANTLAEDELDSGRVISLSDSLDRLRRMMQVVQVEYLTRLHGRVPPQARRELVARIMRRFGTHCPGQPMGRGRQRYR